MQARWLRLTVRDSRTPTTRTQKLSGRLLRKDRSPWRASRKAAVTSLPIRTPIRSSDESEILGSRQPLTEKRRVLCGAQGDALELLQLAEEVLDQVPPFVHLAVNVERCRAARMLGDDGLGAALVQVRDDVIAVERRVADQRPKGEPVNERRHATRVDPLSWQAVVLASRCPGKSTKRTRLPSASVSARILVVRPPLERPMAWRKVPLLRPVRDDGP